MEKSGISAEKNTTTERNRPTFTRGSRTAIMEGKRETLVEEKMSELITAEKKQSRASGRLKGGALSGNKPIQRRGGKEDLGSIT